MSDRDLLSRIHVGETFHVWRFAMLEDGSRSAYEEDVTAEVVALAEQAEALRQSRDEWKQNTADWEEMAHKLEQDKVALAEQAEALRGLLEEWDMVPRARDLPERTRAALREAQESERR